MISVRTAVPSDRDSIEAMHSMCSLESRIGRWHAPLRTVPARYLDDALGGRPGHACAVASVGIDVIGFASAVRGFGDCWEIGVLVRDDLHRRGVGSALIDVVVCTASGRGAVAIAADLRPDRRFLLDVLGRYGALEIRVDGDGIHPRVELAGAALQRGPYAVAGGGHSPEPRRIGLAG